MSALRKQLDDEARIIAQGILDGTVTVRKISTSVDPATFTHRVWIDLDTTDLVRALRQASLAVSGVQSSVVQAANAMVQAQNAVSPRLMRLGGVLPESTRQDVYVGYRDFIIGADDTLLSRNYERWPRYHGLVARCKYHEELHPSPDPTCSCGIYAFNDPTNHQLKQDADVWGEISLWGRVIVCESGYRAQYAYPKALFTRNPLLAKVLEDAYGVPVHVVTHRCGQTSDQVLQEWFSRLNERG